MILKKVARYTLLPEILPRIFALGKHYRTFILIFGALLKLGGLLQTTSPSIVKLNSGIPTSLSDLLKDSLYNLRKSKYPLDKVAFIVAIFIGLFFIIAQTITILLLVAIPPAGAVSATDFFSPSSPSSNDSVLIFLEQVFGSGVGVFQTSASSVGSTNIHLALYDMLSFYSFATMSIAVFIVIYHIITVVGEASISGTPFGRRFNSLWAPIRLVVALGLLVPIANGLNSAQYITLFAAKLGSNLATVSWEVFATKFSEPGDVFVNAHPPTVEYLVKGIFLNEVCRKAINRINKDNVSAEDTESILIYEQVGDTMRALPKNTSGIAFTPAPDILEEAHGASITFQRRDRVESVRNVQNIHYRWALNTEGTGLENPSNDCGIVSIPITASRYHMNHTDGSSSEIDMASVIGIQLSYIAEVANIQAAVSPIATQIVDYYVDIHNPTPVGERDATSPAVIADALEDIVNASQQRLNAFFTASATSLAEETSPQIFEDIIARGWGGAGAWYMRIGQVNRQYLEAARNAPTISSEISSDDNRPSMWRAAWDQILSDLNFRDEAVIAQLRTALVNSETLFIQEVSTDPSLITEDHFTTDRDFSLDLESILRTIFGINALYDFHDSSAANLDPMVGLMKIGDEIIDRSMWFVGAIAGIEAAEALSRIPVIGRVAGPIAAIGSLLSPFLFFFVFAGFALGIVLFYILPLLPFIYFFFAIVGWIMEIFEAIIAMPIWALSHLNIDGEGLPGSLAMNGYFLLLGIFLRPVLILFGMIGGYLIFGAGTFLLHSLFDSAVSSVRGGEDIGAMGSFVYVCIFAFLCYQLALLSFKMVDTVPQGILRWIGQGGATPFSDGRQDIGFSSVGAFLAGTAALNTLQGATNGIGNKAGMYAAAGLGKAKGLLGDRKGSDKIEEK